MTKTRKDGSRGRLRIDYGDHRDPEAALTWLWKYIDAAKTAGKLYGHALVVIAAEETPPGSSCRQASECPAARVRTRTSRRRRSRSSPARTSPGR